MDIVEGALSDPDFLASMAGLPKLGRPTLLERSDDGDTIRTRVRYAFVGELSSAVRAVVDPAQLTWVEDLTTDRRTHRSRFTILPDHYANLLRAGGTFTMAPHTEVDPAGSIRTAEGTVEVSVPFVGGKVERAIVSGLEDHARAEAELMEQWLSAPHADRAP
jgi:hypothetical protein